MDLFEYSRKDEPSRAPLADRMRPQHLGEVVGQTRLLSPGSLLRTAIEHDRVPSLVLWGPPGTGKTTLARLIASQTGGGLFGVVIANLMFSSPAVHISAIDRSGAGNLVSEFLATLVLVFIVLVLVRTGRSETVPLAVGAWVGTTMIATPSTGFANPAVTLARIFTAGPTGIAPVHAFLFVVVQLLAAVAAWFLVHLLTKPE